MTSDQDKQALREHVWALLEANQAAPPGVRGTIPNFYGAEATAARLRERPEWLRAQAIKANPDRAQRPIRVLALEDNKLLYVAVPKMATLKPFYVLDPTTSTTAPEEAIEAAASGNRALVGTDDMRPIDMVICGSVAVNRTGARLGKGAGYSDLEVALLIEAGLVSDETTIVAPIHALQLVGEDIPTSEHDFKVDLIVTPDEVIECARVQRPIGLVWNDLSADKIAAIPILSARSKNHPA